MIIDIKIKKLGDRNIKKAKLKINDDFKDILEKYTIEMIEYENFNSTSIVILDGDEEVYSDTILRPNIGDNLKLGIKKTLEGFMNKELSTEDENNS